MNKVDRECFLRDLAENQLEVNELFTDYGIESPATDCDDEECDLPLDDNDLIMLHKLYSEINAILEKHR